MRTQLTVGQVLGTACTITEPVELESAYAMSSSGMPLVLISSSDQPLPQLMQFAEQRAMRVRAWAWAAEGAGARTHARGGGGEREGGCACACQCARRGLLALRRCVHKRACAFAHCRMHARARIAPLQVHHLAIGRGQGAGADKLIRSSVREACWVVLENTHLAGDWMPQLCSLVQVRGGGYVSPGERH